MIIKRYIVSNMNEAMTRIRYELGKDAVIISQRKIKKPGLKGFFSKKVLEVTAAIENVKKNDEDISDSIEAIKKAVEKETIKNAETVKNGSGEESKNTASDSELLKEMLEMKTLLSDMVSKTPEKNQRRSKLQIKLEDSDLNEKLVKKVLAKLKL